MRALEGEWELVCAKRFTIAAATHIVIENNLIL